MISRRFARHGVHGEERVASIWQDMAWGSEAAASRENAKPSSSIRLPSRLPAPKIDIRDAKYSGHENKPSVIHRPDDNELVASARIASFSITPAWLIDDEQSLRFRPSSLNARRYRYTFGE